MSVSETESLLCLAKEKGIDDLAGQLVRSRDHRALTGEEREILDQELMRNMENVSYGKRRGGGVTGVVHFELRGS